MLPSWVLFLVSAAYVGLLFGIAFYGDRRAERSGAPTRKPWIYSLALGVYCTSWTFYGAVGRAASGGWDYLPIYLGPILVFIFGWRVIARIVQISKRHNITSIADFIGARYGRHQRLAMLVTLVAVCGVLPYIALQIKAVAFGFEILAGPELGARAENNALLIALLLAAFSILFGTRHVVSTENHHGMMLAVAFESACKLLAFVVIGLFAIYGVFDGPSSAYSAALALPQMSASLSQPEWILGFIVQTLLAATAAICLPRQFHVTVVENTAVSDLKTARWMFPVYLGLISVLVPPILAAGMLSLPAGTAADTFVLALPQSHNQTGIALAAYLGGFSAATSMVIVATVALATMICNEMVMPLLFRWAGPALARRQDLSGLLKLIRRLTIILLVALAYGYYRLFSGQGTLASIGLLSFAAVLHFLPSLIGGLYWRRASYQGAIAGLVTGFVLWIYTLLLPTLLPENATLLMHGPFSIEALRPTQLFGLGGFDTITHGTLVSFGAHLLVYVLASLRAQPGLRERLQAARFLEDETDWQAAPAQTPRTAATVGDLQTLLERFFGPDRARKHLSQYIDRAGRALRAEDRAEPSMARYTEHLLAGALGASSARLLLASTLRGRDMQLEDVIRLLDETSHEIQFNRELLRATLEHLSQGVSVVDKDLRLVAWNRRYIEMFHYSTELITVGRPIEDVVRFNARRGLLGTSDIEEAVKRRLDHLRIGNSYTHQRELADGSVVEIRGNPMPGGGFVTSYSDVSDYKRSEEALREINETLESRVEQRTRELTELNVQLAEAKLAAERADEAKTRFLASASHDLVQPLHAARLFLSSVDQEQQAPALGALLHQVSSSLSAAESLLTGLLDISRLDARAQSVQREHFEIRDLLDPLAAEFAVLAQESGLRMHYVASHAVVETDPRLLRRVLQNFLSNAISHTPQGRVLLGCRRLPGALRIEVWDTGPGIAAERQREIFEEFRRLQLQDARGERGLGLGLAIAERIARLLGHRLGLRSSPGRGSVFYVSVPLGRREAFPAKLERPTLPPGAQLNGACVLCLDNEPAVLAALRALLSSWGCEVLTAAGEAEARSACERAGRIPDLLLIDYQLDDGLNGVTVTQALWAAWGSRIPGIVMTADHTPQAKNDAQAQDLPLLPKPVKPAALRALMSRLLSQRDNLD